VQVIILIIYVSKPYNLTIKICTNAAFLLHPVALRMAATSCVPPKMDLVGLADLHNSNISVQPNVPAPESKVEGKTSCSFQSLYSLYRDPNEHQHVAAAFN
jgi:hypothetical protein